MALSLYLIHIGKDIGYDEFDSWVVAARSRKQALRINPYHQDRKTLPILDDIWCETATAEFIGRACVCIRAPEIICASFNAG